MHICNDSGIQNEEEGINGKVRNPEANARGREIEETLKGRVTLF